MGRNLADVVPLRVQQQAYKLLPPAAWRMVRDVGSGATSWQRRVSEARRQRMLLAEADTVDGSVSIVRYRGEHFLARRSDHFRAIDVLADNAALIADALEVAGIRYLMVDAQTSRRRVIAVAESDRAAVWTALVAASSRRPVYGRQVHPRRDQPSVRLVDSAADKFTGTAYTVFEVQAAPESDRALSGPELGGLLEFWTVLEDAVADDHDNGEPLAAGTWVAPRRNRWVNAVPGGPGDEPASWEVDGVTRPAIPVLDPRHAFDVDFPIDVVYTWVDGADPEWQVRKASAHTAVGLGELNEFATNESRFLSRDELRYSLRSLDMYASWVRHVYLVTDDQTPSWLDTTNPRITVVSHRELFGDRGRLPTFNSHAIESQLHHVPGLSDHFLYLNDDFFFGRPVEPRLFFHGNGLARFFTSTAKLGLGSTGAFDRPVMSGGKNNRDLLHKAFDRTVTNKFKHVPQSLLKDVLLEMEERFSEAFASTASHQFRDPRDLSIAASLHHHYAYISGRAVEGDLRYLYADIAAPDTARRLERLLRRRDFDTFCLNDHDTSGIDPLEQQRMLHEFLSNYFPLPSSFEKRAP